jgi:hypothetical protein
LPIFFKNIFFHHNIGPTQAVSGLPDPSGEKERHNSESDSQAAGSGSEDTKDQGSISPNSHFGRKIFRANFCSSITDKLKSVS